MNAARRLILPVLAAVLGVLASTSAVAFAAAPETPEVSVESIRAASVTLHGVLNPKATGPVEGGTYQFVYRPSSKDECKGAGEVAVPVSPGLALGLEPDQVFENVEGLSGGTEYAVCLVEKNLKGEPAVSAVVPFTTAIPPETPEKLEAKPVAGTTATLNGVLNPGKAGDAGSYEFSYLQSSSECQGAKQVTTPEAHATGAKEEPATSGIEGLLPETQYTFCLRVHNQAGEEATSAPVTFTTLPVVPVVEESFVTDVSSTGATLQAQLNPGGAGTTYRFEGAVGSGAFKPVTAPGGEGEAGSGIDGIHLEAHLQELSASTTYRFRVLAENAVSRTMGTPVLSEERVFTTQRAGGEFVLPDGRQWELVSPPQKLGSRLKNRWGPEGNRMVLAYEDVVQASVDGDAFVDGASSPTESEPAGAANGSQLLMTRGPGGWGSQVISPPHGDSAGAMNGLGSEYRFFSEDLSGGLVQQFGNFAPLSPEASEETPYIRADYLGGDVGEHCEGAFLSSSSCYRPLVTRGDTQPGTVFGGAYEGECLNLMCGPLFEAASPDLNHVILGAAGQLTSTPVAVGTTRELPSAADLLEPALYEWSGGRLQLVNVLPGREDGGGLELPGEDGGGLELPGGDQSRVVSDNGERVVLEGTNGGGAGTGSLYVREVGRGVTVQLNLAEPGCGVCESGGGGYMTASSDGSRVFFLDNDRLTARSSPGGTDLYEYDFDKPEGERLIDLTPAGGEATNVQEVLGASEDGAYVYYVTHAGDVYVSHAGVTRFVTQGTNFVESGSIRKYSEKRVRVSPDGRWLAFMSNVGLTGYDTRDAVAGAPDEEVYLYHAPEDLASQPGTLTCASCNPTGARPVGIFSNEAEVGEVGIASILPGWDQYGNPDIGGDDYQPRFLSDGGRLFFDSKDALVPRDVNGVVDVYEYEPEGVPAGEDACGVASQSGSEVFKPARKFDVESREGEERAGCVALVSSGTSPEQSTFLDASASGGDVFFMSSARLTTEDLEGGGSIFDAHECTSGSPCVAPVVQPPPPCDTEASCKAAPTPQPAIFGAPSSATLNASATTMPPAGLAPSPPAKKVVKKTTRCRGGFHRARAGRRKCVREKKAMKAGKASDERRAGR